MPPVEFEPTISVVERPAAVLRRAFSPKSKPVTSEHGGFSGACVNIHSLVKVHKIKFTLEQDLEGQKGSKV
jgi:hypothetical protein